MDPCDDEANENEQLSLEPPVRLALPDEPMPYEENDSAAPVVRVPEAAKELLRIAGRIQLARDLYRAGRVNEGEKMLVLAETEILALRSSGAEVF